MTVHLVFIPLDAAADAIAPGRFCNDGAAGDENLCAASGKAGPCQAAAASADAGAGSGHNHVSIQGLCGDISAGDGHFSAVTCMVTSASADAGTSEGSRPHMASVDDHIPAVARIAGIAHSGMQSPGAADSGTEG